MHHYSSLQFYTHSLWRIWSGLRDRIWAFDQLRFVYCPCFDVHFTPFPEKYNSTSAYWVHCNRNFAAPSPQCYYFIFRVRSLRNSSPASGGDYWIRRWFDDVHVLPRILEHTAPRCRAAKRSSMEGFSGLNSTPGTHYHSTLSHNLPFKNKGEVSDSRRNIQMYILRGFEDTLPNFCACIGYLLGLGRCHLNIL